MLQFFNKKINNRRISRAGFTLVELMVSLTIFSIVITISTGAILVLVDANAKAQALFQATTNVSFALDFMTREMRMGYSFKCYDSLAPEGQANGWYTESDHVTPCVGGSTESVVGFVREKDERWIVYRIDGGAIERKEDPETGQGSFMRLTSENIVIDTFKVDVFGTTVGDGIQPQASTTVSGYVKNNNGLDTETDFSINTLITQRHLDI